MSTEEQAQVRARKALSSYASGNRTFCNANLRGANFQGQDLSGADFSGADFSGADIRSAKFANALLEGANFSRAQGGLQRRYVSLRLVLVFIGIALTGAFHGFIGVYAAFSFDTGNTSAMIAGAIYLLFTIAVLVAVGWQGFTSQALVSVLAASLISFMGITLLTDLGEGAGLGIAFVVAFASATTINCVVMLPTMFSFIDTDNSAVSFFTFSRIVLAILLVALLIAIFFSIVSSLSITTSVTGAFLSTAAMSLFSSHVAKQVLCENNKFAAIRSWSMGLGTSGGTSFCGADLQGANFSHANLKNTRFAKNKRFANLQKQPAKLTRVCWKQAKGLDFALFGQHILKDRRVRTLLTTPEKVRNRDFTDSNLRGADLTNVRLEKAIFKRAILSDAIFKKANLLEANFTEAQVVNTDFTEACLTGAILESWNTNNNTIFKGVDCKHIFLRANFDKKGDRERRPHDPDKDFHEGDFERIFGKVPNEVQVIIRKGISPADFQAILQEIAKNHPGTRLKFVKDVDKTLVVSFEAHEETDKAEFERDIYRKLDELDNELRAVKEEGQLYVQQLSERALPSPMIPHTNNIYYTDKVVNVNNPSQRNNENPSINVKGDFTVTASNSAVSIGDSSQVSNQISQLGETETQTQLKNLLAQLQAMIEAEPELSEEEKTEALVKIREIAEAGQSPADGPMKKAAKRSLDVLKRITLGLSETTRLATTAKGLLDSISLLFGL